MTQEQASNSVYDINNNSDFSEPSNQNRENEKEGSDLYSSGYVIELSGIQSEAEISDSIVENNHNISEKTESIRSLWTTSNDASDYGKHSYLESQTFDNNTQSTQESSHSDILPNDSSPLVYNGHLIRYNIKRGVEYNTPIIFGSRKLTGINGKNGYRSSHFVFDPKSGSLASGYDIDNGWRKLSNFSFITGIGNSSELDASLISGSHNKIQLELLANPHNHSSDQSSSKDNYHLIPPSCAIIGGSNNTITNNSIDHYSTGIIASSGIQVKNCQETVILGMRGVSGDKTIENMQEATLTRNLYGLSHIYAGPYTNESVPPMTVFVANGNSLIKQNLKVESTLDSNSITTSQLFADTASIRNAKISNIEAHNVIQNDVYFEGTGGATATFVIHPTDNYNVVYVNPINGPVNIYLGTGTNNLFRHNHSLTFKDVTLEFGLASSYNVNITVSGATGITGITGMIPVRIEHYNVNNRLIASSNSSYILNTSGGSVSFRYFSPSVPGLQPTWVIESQFMGNQRILPTSGLTFASASDSIRAKLLCGK